MQFPATFVPQTFRINEMLQFDKNIGKMVKKYLEKRKSINKSIKIRL